MAYTEIDDPSAYFQTALYSGNAGTQSITNDGNSDLQPNWVWIKQRSGTQNHNLQDSVRGSTKILKSNTSADETTDANGVTSFNTDGFSIGTRADINQSGTYVAWQWKAGTSFTNDASGTGIGSIDSAGSVNTDAGFSIISYTGTGSAATVAHGLGSAPRMIIIKDRSNSNNWGVYHQSMGNTYAVYLDLTNEKGGGNSSFWNSTSPTSSVFSINTRVEVNASSANMIAYCFAEKQSYSKFGSYIGNGNADGTFVYLGFKPAFVMIKRTDGAANWELYDNKRLGYNSSNPPLYPDLSNAEGGNGRVNILSNGFKIVTTSGNLGASGGTYIYMAFAENPFVASNFVPATAR